MPRLARWLRFRLLIPVFRSRHGAEVTARGVANGVFWGLTPSVGFQTFAIVTTWFVARKALRRDSSLLQAMIWAWVNNPITMIPLYYTFYITGLWLVGDSSTTAGYMTFADLWTRNVEGGRWGRVTSIAATIGIPLMLGSLPYALVGTALSYRWTILVLRRRQSRLRQHPHLTPDPARGAPRE